MATGKSESETKEKRDELKLDIADFVWEASDKLGDGSFSEVYKCSLHKRMSDAHPMHKYGQHFAIKLIDKRSITINRQSKQFIGAVLRERNALYQCQNVPFVLQLYATAKNDRKIAFITQLCPNHDLLQCLEKYGPFSISAIKYYAACLIYCIKYLHSNCIIHRDIKPENIMLNELNQPILSDFGCVKLIGPKYESESVKSDPDFVGTPQFMAPELITIPKSLLTQSPEDILYGNGDKDDENDNNDDEFLDDDNKDKDKDDDDDKENAEYFKNEENDKRLKDEYYKCLDLWSLGCLLYQLRTGKLLFKGETEFLVFKEVKTMNFTLDKIKDETFKSLLNGLLKEKPMERLGANDKDLKSLQDHTFFDGIEWDKLPEMTAPPLNDNLTKNDTENKPESDIDVCNK